MNKPNTVSLDLEKIRKDFPILENNAREQPFVYLDSAASSQKPQVVMDVISQYYSRDNSNVHRGVYELSQRATEAYEKARQAVADFINANHRHEVIFTKGTTESINLVATSFGQQYVQSGDEIVISAMEHHANIVPWQLLCQRTGAQLKVIHMDEAGVLDMEHFVKLLNEKTKLVAVSHISNALGTVNPVKQMIQLAHERDIPVLLDAAQSVPHQMVDVDELECDFFAFSSHKMYGPTGVGVLYAKEQWLEAMPPYQAGGDMIRQVSFEHTEFNVLPYKFEAGTPNIAGVIGLGAAIEYINEVTIEAIAAHEKKLMYYATKALSDIAGLRIIGTAPEKVGVISFVMDEVHPHDIGTVLDSENIAIRVGHHCAMPVMQRFGLPATARASFGIYNTYHDVDRLVAGLNKVKEIFHV